MTSWPILLMKGVATLKKALIITCIALMFVWLPTSSVFAQTKVGTTAAPFLGIAVGARAIGTGGAFAAVADDATALYWNNAGIAQLPMSEVIVVHNEWIADMSFDYVGTVINMGPGALGVSLTSLSMDEMDVTTVEEPEGTGERFDAGDLAVGLSYAHAITDRFHLGGTVKYIRQSIWKESASGFAFDLGTLYETHFFNGLKIGAIISNFGTSMRMEGDDLVVQHDPDDTLFGNNDNVLANMKTDHWNLPINFRVGVAMDVLNDGLHRVTLASDAMHPNDNEESMSVGGEYGFKNMLFLRAGYKSVFLEDGEEGLTLGAGFHLTSLTNIQLGLDYAYQDFGRLGNPHVFSFMARF